MDRRFRYYRLCYHNDGVFLFVHKWIEHPGRQAGALYSATMICVQTSCMHFAAKR